MRAVVVDRWMQPSELEVREVPTPRPGAGELVVEVRAAGGNFFDTLIVQGRYQRKPEFPFTPGGEVAGVVAAVGGGGPGFAVGDRVIALTDIGGFAESCVARAEATWPLPDAMSFEVGAALPIVYPTSYAALVYRADLAEGETLLVHAAAGGVGLAAVQIGKALGARVIATAGGPEKCAVAARAGADATIDYRGDDFEPRVQELTGGRGADVIYDSVGGDTTDKSLRCIAWNGRLLIVGFASGTIPEIKANRILLKNIAVTGVHWSAFKEKDPDLIDPTFEALFTLHDEGLIEPLISATWPLERITEALGALGSRKTHGKVIITP
jgi:NADPH2:quinone reductase